LMREFIFLHESISLFPSPPLLLSVLSLASLLLF